MRGEPSTITENAIAMPEAHRLCSGMLTWSGKDADTGEHQSHHDEDHRDGAGRGRMPQHPPLDEGRQVAVEVEGERGDEEPRDDQGEVEQRRRTVARGAELAEVVLPPLGVLRAVAMLVSTLMAMKAMSIDDILRVVISDTDR